MTRCGFLKWPSWRINTRDCAGEPRWQHHNFVAYAQYASGNATCISAVIGEVCALWANNKLHREASINAIVIACGVHIFQDSLFIGEDFDADDILAGEKVPAAGEGAILTIEAGAKIAPEVVLNKAESRAPKNRTCIARGVNFITKVGINKSSSASSEGYNRTAIKAINKGNKATVRYMAPAAILALAAIFSLFADITR